MNKRPIDVRPALVIMLLGSACEGELRPGDRGPPTDSDRQGALASVTDDPLAPMPPHTAVEVWIGPEGSPVRRMVRTAEMPELAFASLRSTAAPPDRRPLDKIEPSLMAARRLGGPGQRLEVAVAVESAIRFTPLPALDPRQPRHSPWNQERLRLRRQEFARQTALRESSLARWAATISAEGGEVIEQHAMGNAIIARLDGGTLDRLAQEREIAWLGPNVEITPPPADANPNNDLIDGRARITSDPFVNEGYDGNLNGWIGLIDTGVHLTHTLFRNPPQLGYVVDCVNGGTTCFNDLLPGYNPFDAGDHGTKVAGIISANANLGAAWRGVTLAPVDSWKVGNDSNFGGTNLTAVLRAFPAALNAGDTVIAAVIQVNQSPSSAYTKAANDAFDLGAVVVAANGNFTGPARSPANGHKVLGVAGYVVDTGALPQFNKNTTGLYKPDIMMPTSTESASSAGDTALAVIGGTSGATPYAAAAAQLLRDFYWGAMGFGTDPGAIYASLIAFGNQAPNRTEGAGRVALGRPRCSRWFLGATSLSEGLSAEIPFTVGSGESQLKVGVWWPNASTDNFSDIDLRVFRGATPVAQSLTTGSNFERAQSGGTLATGTWSIRLTAARVSPFGSVQLVHYLIYSRTPC